MDSYPPWPGLRLLAKRSRREQQRQSRLPSAWPAHEKITLWEPLRSDKFETYEKVALIANVFVALAGLAYALMLVKQVRSAPQGTPRMQEIALAVREGANAYLFRQFRVVGVLIVVITAALYFAAQSTGTPPEISIGRALAFLVGSIFSATVGFVGMRLATIGNLRVAAAAQHSFGQALQLGYRTGTITGMLTDGLGLLGGSIIFLIYGEHAYEALLGFGFGGTLLALFMRVGGGIYTKAADVGADLVGKIEKGIPEDDPRNAATIADNVGDNVGDCAGMAADIFESYEVTIVAAMILGIASFGHKGVIFPLLVRAIGVIASIISTYSVRAGDKGSVGEAMKSVNRGFVIGSVLSVIGFILLGLFYLHFDANYLAQYPQAQAGFPLKNGVHSPAGLPYWANFGVAGLDMRAAWTCLIGIVLAVALNKCTEYYTGTEFDPVKSLARNCSTGHATNIIQGFAVGYESTVAAVMIIVAAILASAGLCGHECDIRGLRRGHVRHRHADPDRQHHLDGRLRPGGRQRQRHRRNGLRPRGNGRREIQDGPANSGRPGRGRQHHQGHHQGNRHRLGRDRRRVAVQQLHRLDRLGWRRRECRHQRHCLRHGRLRADHLRRSCSSAS